MSALTIPLPIKFNAFKTDFDTACSLVSFLVQWFFLL